MMTWPAELSVEEAFRLIKNLLHEEKIETAALDARLLVMHSLGLSHAEMIARPEKPLMLAEKAQLETLVNRRLAREPMSHILGSREFYGRKFLITSDVLTPRPDSEVLIEMSRALLGNAGKKWRFLDLGTGSGCLLLTLLDVFKNAHGVGVDLSAQALDVARENAKKLGSDRRVEFYHGSWFAPVDGVFDLIISNPPYIETHLIKDLQKEVREYEPHLALDGGVDGLQPYDEIITHAPDYLSAGGRLVLEIGHTQKEAVFDIFKRVPAWNMADVQSARDIEGRDRCIYAVR